MAGRVFITVAEVSGDKHAAQLIRSLKSLDSELIIEGLGGPEMAAAGAIIHRDTVADAAMGWHGALRAFEVVSALRWARKHFETNRPDLQIGVDSPSMNFHFARVAHRCGIPVLQYVAPQLWAWAPWRMKKLKRWVDQVACILPFEEAYFRGHGVNATFVGHPLFDQLPRDVGGDRERFPRRPPVIGLLPGSRRSEAAHNFAHLLDVADRIHREFPQASFVVPTTPATDPVVRQMATNSTARLPIEIGLDRFDQMVPGCDLCLTVSGTATLHVAGLGVPMIVVYRVSPITWNLGARWIVRTRTFALVNVLSTRACGEGNGGHVVPEFVPWYGSNEPLAAAALELLRHPEKLEEQRGRLRQIVQTLDRQGASLRTAQLALEMIRARSASEPPIGRTFTKPAPPSRQSDP